MLQWINNALQSGSASYAALPLALLLGFVSSTACVSCCGLPAIGMFVAYTGTRKDTSRRATLIATLAFMLGTIVALVTLGVVAGFAGQGAQAALGKYWKIFAGLVAVVIGVVSLRLLPVRLPQFGKKSASAPATASASQPAPSRSMVSTILAGLLIGGGVAVASLGCSSGILIVMGAAIIQGHVLWGMSLMLAFAIGFSLLLGVVLYGISRGKASLNAQKMQKLEAAIRTIAGILLIAAGFYLLATV